jgi:hypothetical protein
MAPQLGVLSTVHPTAARQVFEKDCLIRLGSCVAPVGPGKEGQTALKVSLEMPGGKREEISVPYGYIRLVPLADGENAKAILRPEKSFDVGEGKGRERTVNLRGGVVGLIFDCRGRRPFTVPEDRTRRIAKLAEWNEALQIYPAVKSSQTPVAVEPVGAGR